MSGSKMSAEIHEQPEVLELSSMRGGMRYCRRRVSCGRAISALQ
jgi:hypothetical protein